MAESRLTSARRAVKAISAQEKIKAIDRVHEGESKASVARDIGVPESTLRGWCKGEEKLRNAVAQLDTPSPPPPKMAKFNDNPIDFSKKTRKRTDREPQDLSVPVNAHSPGHDSGKAKTLPQDALIFWPQPGQATQPVSPMEGQTADHSPGWFWKWYKSHDFKSQTLLQLSENETPTTASEAVYHGERFLRYLERGGDPCVTAVQVLQISHALNSVKESAKHPREASSSADHRK